MKHVTLKQINGELVMYQPRQRKEDDRDTEVVYYIQRNQLVIGGREIAKHPQFKNVGQLEGWANKYFAEGRDGYDPDNKSCLVSVGAGLREIRKLKGLTLKDMVEKTGVAHRTLSEIENGKSNTSLNTLEKIMNVLGVRLEIVTE